MKYTLENGIEIEYDDDKHIYKVDDEIIPSVTKILNVINKPKLLGWAVNSTAKSIEHNIRPNTRYTEEDLEKAIKDAKRSSSKIKKVSALLGGKVHKILENIVSPQGEIPLIEDPQTKQIIDNFMKWWQSEKPDLNFIEAERLVYSPTKRYCGTLDFLAQEGDDLIVGEFKTTKAIYPEFFLQTAAYQMAFEEETGKEVSKRMIVRVDKDGKGVECQETDEIYSDSKAFMGALDLYTRLEELKR